jgi:hypothetical protein
MCFNNLLKEMIITFITISWTIWNNVDFFLVVHFVYVHISKTRDKMYFILFKNPHKFRNKWHKQVHSYNKATRTKNIFLIY